MKKFNLIDIKLLTCLADGRCHSGNDLGLLLNMSRTAIWKHITQLIDLGLPILRIPRRGYQLASSVTLLDKLAILHELELAGFTKPIDLHLFLSIDSTNRLLKDLPQSKNIDVCCAEMQTKGRGRFGRQWYSPFGDHIYFSSRWHFNCDLSRLSGLSLVVSLAIMATLDDFGLKNKTSVKWPNDILWGHKKLCGSLIEVMAESNGGGDVVIGIGLNVNSKTPEPNSATSEINPINPPPDRPWCSLYDITGAHTDRNLVIARLIIHLNNFLDEFMMKGFAAFITKWNLVDGLKGHMITVSHHTGSIQGKANGVNESGQLILIDDMGTTHYLSSGDTSLHCMDNLL